MKLTLRAEKQNYCLTSPNYVITIVFAVSCIKQKNYFFKILSYFLRLLFAFTKIFVFNDGQITEEIMEDTGKSSWKIQEKIKLRFIQKPCIYLLVKSGNPQIFYIINIMNFSKFTQKIYFYLLVASLYLIRSKSKIFIHSFISCRLPCPNE